MPLDSLFHRNGRGFDLINRIHFIHKMHIYIYWYTQ